MSHEVHVPASGESITSANIARWHKRSGDVVKSSDVIVTLDTDKISNDLEAGADGVLEILVPEGEEVAIGATIARIAEGSAATASPEPATTSPQVSSAAQEKPAASPATSPTPPAKTSAEPADLHDVTVPPAGESITSATVSRWEVKNGDIVNAGDTLVILDTDKVSNQLEAPVAGRIEIIVPEGEEVGIGDLIATIDASVSVSSQGTAGPSPAVEAKTPTAAPQTQASPTPKAAPVASSAPATVPERIKPDLSVVTKPQPRESVGAAVEADGRTSRRKMSMLRRKVATHLVNAQQTAAILTTFNEVDMTAVMEMRKAVQEDFVKKHGVKLGFMSFFVKAVTQALKDVPSINGRIEGTDVIENHYYDIGVAIGTEKGLIVPVLRDADQKSFAQIEKDILDYAAKAKAGKLVIEDLQGGVFTISNGGVYGSLLSTPILNPPQSGILGMHTIQQRPVALNGQVAIRPMMYLALSYDHRLVDGKEAVTFLIRIKESLEAPARMLLEM